MWSSNIVGWLAVWLLATSTAGVNAAEQHCERLKASLTYTQEKAPRDLSSVLPVVVEKVNRVLDGVVDVEVEWKGADLHGRVGEHIVECTVTRLASAVASASLKTTVDEMGREVTSQCFHVPFTILDTNECMLPAQHTMRHKCPEPSVCVNTIGSYECVCPQLHDDDNSPTLSSTTTANGSFWEQLDSKSDRTPWELSFATNSKSSCPSSVSTHGCCPERAHTPEGQRCRKRFHCPVDPCAADSNDCARNAQCVRADRPTETPSYTCQCPDGLMGNGLACRANDPKPQPKVMFDGVTPTELTLKNNFYCGCTRPVVDACSGFPPCKGKHEVCTVTTDNKPTCACKPGYVLHDKYGCVDQNPPTLKLRHDPNGDKTLRLKQGDEYREHMVDIIDDNAEDYLRSLKITYSEPLPPGCLTQVGEFHVNYTVAMPWATPPYVRVTRRVIIDDIDECEVDARKYERSCPPLVPQCDTDAGAKCINTIGSYECHCPSQSTGDGFLKTADFGDYRKPTTYQGGTGCVDTSKPLITLQGPNPKVFKIVECGGLGGVMKSALKPSEDKKELHEGQRQLYEDDIKELIRSTAGAELCATHDKSNPKPTDCVKAIDATYKGDVDLSDRVVVGDPVQKSPLHWAVPYNVQDNAGNQAVTVWREVVVQEVDLASIETIVRDEVTREMQAEQQAAVQRAVREEKAKWEREQVSNRRKSAGAKTCPACPACECPNTPQVDSNTCQEFCDNVSQSCKLSDQSYVFYMLLWFESFVPLSVMPFFIFIAVVFSSFYLLRLCLTSMFNPRALQGYEYPRQGPFYGPSQDDMVLQNSHTHPVPAASPAPPPAASLSTNMSNALFSPPYPASLTSPTGLTSPNPGGFGSPPPANGSSTPMSNRRPGEAAFDDSIYNSPPVITPSKTGDGVRRRNPYT